MLKSSPSFRRNDVDMVKKTNVWKKKYSFAKFECFEHIQKHFWFALNFKNVNLAINEKYSQKLYDNPNYYVSLVIF
jgi:hypothetical protein